MKLLISDNFDIKGVDVYKISLSNFGKIEFHPFIATTKWDAMIVELSENTPKGYLRQLSAKGRIIPIINKEEVNPHIMKLLCEILPDDSAKIRATFVTRKAEFPAYLEELENKYSWSSMLDGLSEVAE